MKNKYKFILVLIVFGIICFFQGETIDRIKIDGISGEFLDVLFVTDTKYANNYSHANFNKIKIGMSDTQVKEILGEPLIYWKPKKDVAHLQVLVYSESPKDTHYRIRQIYLDNSIVKKVKGYFYVD
ncbi:hypothetical protein [Algibacter aquimarinus]|uniref:DUF3221 domain-containing protein n=1 Tax=Algibacter aquimarinus TaxID=1136748 RepID=A0ABP9HF13_9FLAO